MGDSQLLPFIKNERLGLGKLKFTMISFN